MPDPLPSLDTIARCLDTVYAAYAMLAGMRLDVFTPLSQRPYTAAQLADELEVDGVRLTRSLLALVQSGLLIQDGERLTATAETAVYLNRHHHSPGHSLARHGFEKLPRTKAEHLVRLLHPGPW